MIWQNEREKRILWVRKSRCVLEVKGNVKKQYRKNCVCSIGCALTDRLDIDIDDQTVSVFFSDLSADQPVCAGSGAQDLMENIPMPHLRCPGLL